MTPPSAKRRGYTAIEVLMAMTVMAIGAAAVMSMQKASVQGNFDARATDIANSIARTWVERIQRDAMQWTTPGPSNPGAVSNLATAQLVQYGAVSNPNQWFRPDQYASDAVPLSPGFDILGRDVPLANVANAVFCAHVRMSPLDGNGLFRVDVRVLWARGINSLALSGGGASVCSASVATDPRPDPRVYHAIYVTTALMGNPR